MRLNVQFEIQKGSSFYGILSISSIDEKIRTTYDMEPDGSVYGDPTEEEIIQIQKELTDIVSRDLAIFAAYGELPYKEIELRKLCYREETPVIDGMKAIEKWSRDYTNICLKYAE